MFDWKRKHKRKLQRINAPAITFALDVKQIKEFKDAVEKQPCPACGHKKLQVVKLEDGPNGWEALISCSNCEFKVAPNVEGFTAANISQLQKGTSKK